MVRVSNLKLIKILEKNARESFVRISKMLGISEAAVRKRIRKMEKEGIIKGYTIDVDYKKLGFNIHALIGIDTSPEHYIRVVEDLKKMEDVKHLYSSTGDHMLMIECMLRDSSELSTLIKKIENIKGVTRICPAILLEKLK